MFLPSPPPCFLKVLAQQCPVSLVTRSGWTGHKWLTLGDPGRQQIGREPSGCPGGQEGLGPHYYQLELLIKVNNQRGRLDWGVF